MIKYIEHRLKKSFCANCVQGQEAELIGKRLQLSEKDRIIDSIKETMEFKATDIKGIRDKILCNYGSSAVQIVNWIKSECTQ